jgi:hypothetical protein
MSEEVTKTEIRELIPPAFEPAMELAGRLAFEKHEGKTINFAFLVGTDAIWPAISEVLSADLGIPDYYSQRLYFSDNENLDLIEMICKSNYSIFQIPGVVAFYNTASARFINILRLRQPSKEDMMKYDDKITDLDDLFCFSINKIREISKEEKACIISTEGDGKVRVYAYGKDDNEDSNRSDLKFIWDINRGKIYRPIPMEYINAAFNYFLDEGTNYKLRKNLSTVIRKISTTIGEGTMLILIPNEEERDKLEKFLVAMEYLRPEWQRNLNINFPKELLRAAFIMDGSTLISRYQNGEVKVEPRYAVYPFQNDKAYGIIKQLIKSELTTVGKNQKRKFVKKLSGKGSKTHGAANLSKLLECKVKIITISADGPVKIWSNELYRNDQ